MVHGDEARPASRSRLSTSGGRPCARCLTDEEVTNRAKQAMIIEKHYGRPMDIEWARTVTTASCTSSRPVRKP